MRYLTLGEVVALHRAILAETGGATGIRDLAALESALAQHKRVAHAAMEVFLNLNGLALIADIDDQERLMLDLASAPRPRSVP